eukprot:UN27758
MQIVAYFVPNTTCRFSCGNMHVAVFFDVFTILEGLVIQAKQPIFTNNPLFQGQILWQNFTIFFLFETFLPPQSLLPCFFTF